MHWDCLPVQPIFTKPMNTMSIVLGTSQAKINSCTVKNIATCGNRFVQDAKRVHSIIIVFVAIAELGEVLGEFEGR